MTQQSDNSTAQAQAAAPEAPVIIGRSLWGDAFYRLRRDRSAVACFLVIMFFAAIAILGPHIYSNWAGQYDYANSYEAPSWQYPLGTDVLGRSVLQKTLLAANTSMTVGLMSNIIAIPLGMILGALAGYFGGWVDDVIVWLYNTLLAVPGIILLVAIKFAFKGVVLFKGLSVPLFGHTYRPLLMDLDQGLSGMYIALGVMGWIGTCRLVRAETMKIRELDYVLAARSVGSNSFMILFRHVLPNVLHLGIIQFSLGFIGAIGAEVTLSYLGLGVGAGVPSWGSMINEARMNLVVGRWWEISAAVGAVFLLVLALNIFGDRLRDAFDPRLRVA